MRRADREAEGTRIDLLAQELEEEGRIEPAIELYRVAAKLGNLGARIRLSALLGDLAMPHASAEAIYWIRRYAPEYPSHAWWNLAMYHRQRGNRRWYLYWLKRSADEGDEDAIAGLNDPDRLKQAWWALDGIEPPPPFRLRGG